MPSPLPAPAERLATLLLWLGKAVAARHLAGWLAAPLVGLILDRLRGIKHRFARLAARIGAGRFSPRRATQRPDARQPPRAKNPLPQGPAWLIKLVPEAAASASQLRFLLADPEMAALLAAAPAPLARPLRSLCRMLGVEPPPILAPPPCARPSTRPPQAAARPAPKRPKRPEKPRYVFGLRYPPPLPDPT